MKKILLVPGLALLMIACHSGTDKKAKLEEFNKQGVELKSKIDTLQSKLDVVKDSIAVLEAELGNRKDTVLKKTTVSVIALKPEIFKNYIDIQGRVDAEENVGVSTEMPGTITKINVKVGDEVSKGEVLAETDARGINQSIADLQVNTDLANQLYEKQKNLWDQKIGTEIQFLQAKTNKESMQKKMEQLQQQLIMSKIISPINGTIDAVDARIGQLAAPGMASIRVINFSNLKVKADVAESYASKIKKGSEVIVRFPDTGDSIISKVSFVSRAISSNTRSFGVEVLLDGSKEFHPNMVAKLNINDYQSEKPVIVISVKSIQKDENNASFVYVVEAGKAKKQIIMLGKEYSGRAEVLSGLKESDMLITSGYDVIAEGDAVEYK
jgi:membrane fusion protein (multidrug efflux system)